MSQQNHSNVVANQTNIQITLLDMTLTKVELHHFMMMCTDWHDQFIVLVP